MARKDTIDGAPDNAAPDNAAPDNAALAKALQEKRDALQKASAEIRDTATKIGRELTEAEKSTLAGNATAIATAEADITALERPTASSFEDQTKVLQDRRVGLADERRTLKTAEGTRRLNDDERRRQFHLDTAIAEVDHQVAQVERARVARLAPAERSKVLQTQRDALAQADKDAGTHLNAPAIANLDKEIENAKAEAASEGEKK